jgi:hypothetical protein
LNFRQEYIKSVFSHDFHVIALFQVVSVGHWPPCCRYRIANWYATLRATL